MQFAIEQGKRQKDARPGIPKKRNNINMDRDSVDEFRRERRGPQERGKQKHRNKQNIL